MIITEVECVTYVGHHPGPEPIFRDRLRRPVDIYPEFRAQEAETFPVTDDGDFEISSIHLHVHTDSGLRGTVNQLSPEQAHVITTVFRPLLLGADPLASEKVWDLLYRSSIHGRRGIGMVALSAIDCALWDIRGQHFGVPSHVLLGGPTRDRIPAYASTLGESLETDAVTRRTKELCEQGFGGLKWFPRWGPGDGTAGIDAVVELVGTVRDAAGPHVDIMLDAWSSWDVPFTVAVAQATRDLNLSWIEEPLLADDVAGYRSLRARVGNDTRIVGGEHEYTRWGLAELVRADVLDLYQPDPHWAGGISEVHKILAVISAGGGQAIPHGQSLQCNAALSFAASPALIPSMEYLPRLMGPYQHFLAHPMHPEDGHFTLPTLPGLGMAIDESAVVDQRPFGDAR